MIPELAEYCVNYDVLWIPGCGTVTETYQALQLGAKVIKAFPGNVLGPGFCKIRKGRVSTGSDNAYWWCSANGRKFESLVWCRGHLRGDGLQTHFKNHVGSKGF